MKDTFSVTELKKILQSLGWRHVPEKDTLISYEYWHNGLKTTENMYAFVLIRRTAFVLKKDFNRIVELATKKPGNRS